MAGPLEGISQDSFEVLARDVAIPDADHAITGGSEQFGAGSVVGRSVASVMRGALEFQDEPLRGAIEVHDEAV